MKIALQNELNERLEEAFHSYGLAGLTLATDEGLLLASYGHGLDLEYIAAISPIARTSTQKVQELTESLRERGIRFNILGLRLKEQSLFLCAAGTNDAVHSPGLKTLLRNLAQMVATVHA